VISVEVAILLRVQVADIFVTRSRPDPTVQVHAAGAGFTSNQTPDALPG